MPSGSWTCWGNDLVGSASSCIRTRRASSTSARSVMAGRPQTARHNRSTFPRLHPLVGKVAERQERGAANDGQAPFCPLAGRDQGLVPDQPASARTRTARLVVCGTRRSLCLLWHHGEHLAATAVSLPSHEDMAQVVGTSNARKEAPMG